MFPPNLIGVCAVRRVADDKYNTVDIWGKTAPFPTPSSDKPLHLPDVGRDVNDEHSPSSWPSSPFHPYLYPTPKTPSWPPDSSTFPRFPRFVYSVSYTDPSIPPFPPSLLSRRFRVTFVPARFSHIRIRPRRCPESPRRVHYRRSKGMGKGRPRNVGWHTGRCSLSSSRISHCGYVC